MPGDKESDEKRGRMRENMTRCMGCMAEISENEEVCRYCGYQKNTDVKEAYYLLPGKIVGEKYLVGKVLGYGGFGVTYIGWDTILQRKVAIKEYLPSDFATRSYGTKTLTVFSGEATVQFEAGLNSFISEAKRLARFNHIPETVDIYDCFMENDTGYIIMEFLEGVTVKEMLAERQKIPTEEAIKIIKPVLRGLSEVHKEGIIHRDIAPDNIFITKKGDVKILDFGAARYATAVQSRSLSVILKPGYAPEEQYRSRGEQGPWTDIYALAATFYRMITGVRPAESIERMVEDTLKAPSELGIEIDPNIENALMNSLNVKKDFRTQDAAVFYEALDSGEEVERVVEEKEPEQSTKLPLWMKAAAAACTVLVCICVVLFFTGKLSFSRKEIDSGEGVLALAEGEEYVPDISGMSYEDAEKILKEKKLEVVIDGMNYSESIAKNMILSQTPRNGETAQAGETVYVIMSGGNEEVMMPELTGMEYEEAKKMLTAQNLLIDEESVTEEYSDFVEKGRVISQNIKAEERIAVQTKIALTVSLGSLSEETTVMEVPDFTGMTMEEAMDVLASLKEETGYTFTFGDVKREYSSAVEKDKIISQGPLPGSEVQTSEPITLVISNGPKTVEVPQLVYVSEEEARMRLEECGLKAVVKTEYSTKVSKGLVISQSIEDGVLAEEGSSVTIVVSLGKKTDTSDGKKGDKNMPQDNVPQNDAPADAGGAQPQEPSGNNTTPTPGSNAADPASDNGGIVVEPDDDVLVVEPDDDVLVVEPDDDVLVVEPDDDVIVIEGD